ncbi:MAG: hypothetical protein JJ894_07295 [Dinoroseobacter sp.]|nr:hypothetical protein [Dinoroseobacter sp.]
MSNASFAKASKILSSLSMAGMPLSVEVLEHQTGIRRLALDKVLEVMVFYGWVSRMGDLVEIGSQIKSWGLNMLSLADLPDRSAPYLQELNRQTGIDVDLSIYSAPHMVFIKKYGFSNHPYEPRIGIPYEAHTMAVGHTFLAQHSRAYLDQYIEKFLPDMSEDALQAHVINPVEATREQGFGMTTSDRIGLDEAICSPVFGANNEVVAIMSLWRPTPRYFERPSGELLSKLPYLHDMTEQLSLSLGSSRSAA